MTSKSVETAGRLSRPAVLLFFLASGCFHGSEEEIGATSLSPPIDASTTQKATTLSTDFVKAIQNHDAAKVDRWLATGSKLTSGELIKESKAYAPFTGGKSFEVDAVERGSSGKRIAVRSHFMGANGKVFRTNLTLLEQKGNLVVEQVLPPTFASNPVGSSGQAQSLGK